MAELRWNPILEEWTIVADVRQDRPVLPRDSCPLCPEGLEIPEPDYDIVSFENRFPSLVREPGTPNVSGNELFKVAPNQGICEVLLYTPEHDISPANMSVARMRNLVEVWVDRTRELAGYEFIRYVFIFENRGERVGVTLSHPHGQIYAFPFIPPIIARELESAQKYYQQHDRCLFCEIIHREAEDGTRVVANNEDFITFVPFYARFPYEVHLYPKRHILDLIQMDKDAYEPFAIAIRGVLQRYEGLFDDEEFPYMMVFHQAPSDRKDYPHYHFHVEFYSLKRGPGKVKYRAGVETGAGTFINPLTPERMANMLREVQVAADE